MRHLRWKRKYFSGFSTLDRPKEALYEDLQALRSEMEHKEHCQDMQDLMTDLNAQAQDLLQAQAGSYEQAEAVLREHTSEIAQTLDQQLPLAALNSPACRDCAICEHTGDRVEEWLEQSASPPGREEKDVAA